MRIAIFGRITENTDLAVLQGFFDFVRVKNISYIVHYEYAQELKEVYEHWDKDIAGNILENRQQLQNCNFAYSFGGDGSAVLFGGGTNCIPEICHA